MSRFLIIITSLVAIVATVYFIFFRNGVPQISNVMVKPQEATPAPTSISAVNISASFDIYTKGTRRIFTDSRYHNLSSDVFIEPKSPNTVQVRKVGITWSDFFATLPMKLTKECLVTGTKQTFCNGETGKLTFYLNEREDKDALDREIVSGDKFVAKYE